LFSDAYENFTIPFYHTKNENSRSLGIKKAVIWDFLPFYGMDLLLGIKKYPRG